MNHLGLLDRESIDRICFDSNLFPIELFHQNNFQQILLFSLEIYHGTLGTCPLLQRSWCSAFLTFELVWLGDDPPMALTAQAGQGPGPQGVVPQG